MKVVLSALLFIASACWAGLQTDKITATDLGSGWYQHDQFGIFYDANNSDWYYHLDHGWIYVKEWDDNGTWMYMPVHDEYFYPESNSSLLEQLPLGWMWSKASFYPQIFSDTIDGWMYGYGKGIFYEYRTKSRYGNGFDYWEIDYSDSNLTSDEILEDSVKYLTLLSIDHETRDFTDTILPFDDSTYFRLGSLTTVKLNFPQEILAADNNWSELIKLCEENPSEMEKRAIIKIQKSEDLVTLVGLTGTIYLQDITFPEYSEVKLRSGYGSINFNPETISVGSVNLYNVKHLGISDSALTVNEFNGIDGHWDLNKKLDSGVPAIVVRQQH